MSLEEVCFTLTQFCRIAKRFNKKGMGLADFYSILTFALIMLIFYFLFKFTLTATTFPFLTAYASNVQDSVSLQSILRTQVQVDDAEINVAQLIALSKINPAKNDLLEKTLLKIMEDSFGASVCSILCIDGSKIKGNGCKTLQVYPCPANNLLMPSYSGQPIAVSFSSDAQQLESKTPLLK